MAKKLKSGVGSGEGERGVEISPNSEDGFVSWKEQVQNMTKDEFEAFLRAKARDILNRAAYEVMEEVVDKVLGEEDEGHQEEEVQGAGVLHGGDKELMLNDRVMEAAVVPDAGKGQIRASPRLRRSNDEHILTKDEERVARKNLEFNEGIPHSSFLIFTFSS
jgi:hypothetical protein